MVRPQIIDGTSDPGSPEEQSSGDEYLPTRKDLKEAYATDEDEESPDDEAGPSTKRRKRTKDESIMQTLDPDTSSSQEIFTQRDSIKTSFLSPFTSLNTPETSDRAMQSDQDSGEDAVLTNNDFTTPTTSNQVTRITRRRRRPCAFGCGNLFSKLAQHYRMAHKLSAEEAQKLSTVALQRERTAKARRKRKICPVPGCNSITSRMSDHMKIMHHFTPETQLALIKKAKCFQVQREMVITNPLAADTASTSTPPPRGGGRGRSFERPSDESIQAAESTIEFTPDPIVGKSDKTVILKDDYESPTLLRFGEWLKSPAGGGRPLAYAKQAVQQIRDYFRVIEANGVDIKFVTPALLQQYLDISKSFSASTQLCYIHSLKQFLQFSTYTGALASTEMVSLEKTFGNMEAALRRKKGKEAASSQIKKDLQRLPPGARNAFVDSEYAKRMLLELSECPIKQKWELYRDLLITYIAVLNGTRAMSFTALTRKDIEHARKCTKDGEEYRTFCVAKHKTAGTYGALMISVPATVYESLMGFVKMMAVMTQEEHVFLDSSFNAIASSSQVNRYAQKAWKASGVADRFSCHFNITKCRGLITTETKNMDPNAAPIIASQLCHSLETANRHYALTRRADLSAHAVHINDKAIRKAALSTDTGCQLNQIEEIELGMDPEKDNKAALIRIASELETSYSSQSTSYTPSSVTSSSYDFDSSQQSSSSSPVSLPTPVKNPANATKTRSRLPRDLEFELSFLFKE